LSFNLLVPPCVCLMRVLLCRASSLDSYNYYSAYDIMTHFLIESIVQVIALLA